jgi:hypothetical protein
VGYKPGTCCFLANEVSFLKINVLYFLTLEMGRLQKHEPSTVKNQLSEFEVKKIVRELVD